MRKLGLIVLVFSFLIVMPKVASAFTLIELNVSIPQFTYVIDESGAGILAAKVMHADGSELIYKVDPQVFKALSGALNNMTILKGRTFIDVGYDIDSDGNRWIREVTIGSE